MKRGVAPQACDHGDPRSHIVEQVDRSEAGIANANDAALRQPARRLDQDLPAPVSKLLILSVSLLVAQTKAMTSMPNRQPVVIGLDDTIERRWGVRIKKRGIYRDPHDSPHSQLPFYRALLSLSFRSNALKSRVKE
jgi:hypothetical protein